MNTLAYDFYKSWVVNQRYYTSYHCWVFKNREELVMIDHLFYIKENSKLLAKEQK